MTHGVLTWKWSVDTGIEILDSTVEKKGSVMPANIVASKCLVLTSGYGCVHIVTGSMCGLIKKRTRSGCTRRCVDRLLASALSF